VAILKRPWFLVFFVVIASYSYKVLRSAGEIHFRTTSASASVKHPVVSVDLETEVLVPKGTQLSINGFESMDVSILVQKDAQSVESGSNSQKAKFILKGKGSSYLNSGGQFKDWILISSSKANEVTLDSAASPGRKSFESLRKKNHLRLKILLPAGVQLSTVEYATVSGDFVANRMSWSALEVASVSGDVSLSHGQVDSVEFNTVSGDFVTSDTKISNLESQSVSGDIDFHSPSGIKSISVNTMSGDLLLKLPAAKLPSVEFSSLAGELEKGHFSGKLEGTVSFSSLSGDVTLRATR